jgi:protein-S-isoprenylcysteine O-methyltransferase Ste14
MPETGLIILKIYLLAGLVFHKALWEILKRRHGGADTASDAATSPVTRLIKLVKLMILAAILVQTILPTDILPISTDPAALRLTGLVIFTLGLLTAVAARIQLGSNWSDIEEGKIADRHAVVASGIYRYIRHPIYTGDILLLLGLQLSLNSWLVLGLLLLVPVVAIQAIKEEQKLKTALPDYAEYIRNTKRFIPFVV